jgi:hypothetical protein
MARQIAREKYDLDPDWTSGFGQAAYAEYVSAAAKELIDTSHFMHHGIDKQVCDWAVFYTQTPLMEIYRAREIISVTRHWRSFPPASSMVQPIPWVSFSRIR